MKLFVFVFAAVMAAVSAKEFFIQKEEVNWYKAVELCNAKGMQLATVDNCAQNRDLKRAIRDAGAAKKLVWISGTDNGEEGKFLWMSTGKAVSYPGFIMGNPDNAGGTEHCVHTLALSDELRAPVEWNDNKCNTLMYYACQERC